MYFSSLPLLTQSGAFIIGPVAKVLGVIMNGIHELFFKFGIESIGFSIIVFTLFVRVGLLPLVLKQQKSMKAMQVVQPELTKLQEKYKNKKDPESQKKFQQEQMELFQKHSYNPAGGCLPMLVQLPIMFSLYAVLNNLPAYISRIKDVYYNIVIQVVKVPGYDTWLTEMSKGKTRVRNFTPTNENKIIDLLHAFNSADWLKFKEHFSAISSGTAPLIDRINDMNYFFTINLGDAPINLSNGVSGLLTVGVLIPILVFASSMLQMKLTPSSGNGNSPQEQMTKRMLMFMPFMSVAFVATMPAGLGLYWLTGNVFQLFQQLIINKHNQVNK